MTHVSFDDFAVSVTNSERSICNKDNARFIDFSVLFRTKHDALRCIDFYLSDLLEPMKVGDIVRDNALIPHNIFGI